jgi:hypothetical protein
MNAKGHYTLLYIISRGVWSEECGVRNVSSTSGLIYEYFISELFSLHTPHSTFHKTTPQKNTKLLICFVIFCTFAIEKLSLARNGTTFAMKLLNTNL